MAHEIGFLDVFPYVEPLSEEIEADDPLAEPEWTPAAVVLAATVVAVCLSLVTLLS